jgi:hypothetical protein
VYLWILGIVFASLLAVLFLWQQKSPPKAIAELVSGVVPEDPQELADLASVDLEVYTLARIGQSEEWPNSKGMLAVMFAALNYSDRTGKTVTEVATAGNPKRSDYAVANGRYGRQGIHPYCSTIAAPSAKSLAIAESVWFGTVKDPTHGARFWDNPRTQDILHAANPAKYKSSAEIAERRRKDGLEMVNVPGTSTRFWV